ncbi:hypothetical protein TDB9533_00402 [Thalassocella blandensis]|nr:hypothetical protein TDB9533_00402 [Thalassocella blandensis]
MGKEPDNWSNIDDYYPGIADETKMLEQKIRFLLSKLGVKKIRDKDVQELGKLYQGKQQHITDLIQAAESLCEWIRKKLNDQDTIRDVEEYDFIRRKKIEQRRKYIDWGHGLVRWIGGSILVVVLYSILVSMSSSSKPVFNWVKIPVHEWFSSNKE